MSEMVPKTFRGGDGREYVFEVDAPPEVPATPPPPTARELLGQIAYGYGMPLPDYTAWTDQQRNYLTMVAATIAQAQTQTQLLARAVGLMLDEREGGKPDG